MLTLKRLISSIITIAFVSVLAPPPSAFALRGESAEGGAVGELGSEISAAAVGANSSGMAIDGSVDKVLDGIKELVTSGAVTGLKRMGADGNIKNPKLGISAPGGENLIRRVLQEYVVNGNVKAIAVTEQKLVLVQETPQPKPAEERDELVEADISLARAR